MNQRIGLHAEGRLSLCEGEGEGEGLAGIHRSNRTPQLHPLPLSKERGGTSGGRVVNFRSSRI